MQRFVMPSRHVTRRVYVASLALGFTVACNSSTPEMPTTDVPEGSRGEEAVREQCNGEGRTVDVNNDGTPDIRHVQQAGVDRCVQFDMNFDGIIDITRFFGPDGRTVVREEHDFDFDGRLDQISYFENGQIVRNELDTNFDNRIDTWLWCNNNLLERSERDRRHNGRADTWEVFQAGVISEARYDENNDGNPDRWEVFTGGVLTQIRRADPDGVGPPLAEEIPREAAGGVQATLSCDGSQVTAAAPAPPAPPAPVTPAPEGVAGGAATSGGEAPATTPATEPTP
jgi:hypothetical protein